MGHIASALYVWGVARAFGAKIILRIEDHDSSRCKKHFEESILRDLEWLGFLADEGVNSVASSSPFRQSDCDADYVDAIKKLETAKLIYYCDCSRQSISQQMQGANQTSDELFYPGFCRTRRLSAGPEIGTRFVIDSEVIRFDDLLLGHQVQNPAEQCGDVLVKDRHGNWTYHFAVSVDDLKQGVNLIIRGQDLLASTGRQIYLANKLGRKKSPEFFHHPLIVNEDGKKLSKRLQSEAVASYRQDHASPARLLADAAKLVGLVSRSVNALSVNDLGAIFQNLKKS
jgi:glutamyl-Q tRNA(Asp) synthetase